MRTISVLGFWAVLVMISCARKTVPAGSQAGKDAITFMSYNVHHCNPPSKPGVIDVDAVVRVIKKENPDVVALQEIDVNTGRSGKINQAALLSEKTGYHSFHFSKSIDHDGGDYGIMILSKYPLSDMATHKLPTDPATGGEPRVLSLATVTLPGGKKIRVASTHLDFHGKTNGKLQMTEVNRILADERLPVIIGGDFNATEKSETIQLLDKAFTRTCHNCAFTIEEGKEKQAIDFIAYKPGNAFSVLSHHVVAEDYASDHRPVQAVLKIGF
ncbi:endonuclease/exonuclease/phosphatase family protein [Niabella drilacis]|uniref:Metal-dependent hydrolase, endonuclease/exonuclease/phosphatase family n=1 Tax=Niabella drilacis (strain DSM 25811 / CCM 8410 / CCUG 62505 / LMG 26954 / E90) TaxID=1285928 RepID=A0A1G6ZR94_NIADE|nr:endonuclease/exonuclease/phosphatase family protein [Niabella drilacis]SDE05022.1 Metal-dependent hydrolase, endonuclease/exonuclease/phosphatase family [Niabella drilacis]